jgi:hypothetical protein
VVVAAVALLLDGPNTQSAAAKAKLAKQITPIPNSFFID